MKLIYIIGEPGIGKSTLMRALTERWLGYERTRPFAHMNYREVAGGPVVAQQLGKTDGPYPGTDRLSMSVITKAREFVRESEVPLILAEGDRLATTKFLGPLDVPGKREVTLARLVAPPKYAEFRREERGSHQNESWLAGRRTKCVNLWDAWLEEGGCGITLDATMQVDDIVANLRYVVRL